MITDSSGASGGYLSCFGKKDTKEADQGVWPCSRTPRRSPWIPQAASDRYGRMFQCCYYRTETLCVLSEKALREGYIGEGAYDCGSKHLSASPVPHSLGTFLAEQESTAPGRVNNFVFYIIYYFSQKEKQVTKNLRLGLLFGHFYGIVS